MRLEARLEMPSSPGEQWARSAERWRFNKGWGLPARAQSPWGSREVGDGVRTVNDTEKGAGGGGGLLSGNVGEMVSWRVVASS
jgi:hypothetical protein